MEEFVFLNYFYELIIHLQIFTIFSNYYYFRMLFTKKIVFKAKRNFSSKARFFLTHFKAETSYYFSYFILFQLLKFCYLQSAFFPRENWPDKKDHSIKRLSKMWHLIFFKLCFFSIMCLLILYFVWPNSQSKLIFKRYFTLLYFILISNKNHSEK
jgi:hypothetical protein